MVQQLKLCTPRAGGPDPISGQGTRFHLPRLKAGMLQQRSHMAQQRPSRAK